MSIVLSILIMLLILTVLVVVHEWGHYISARIFGVKVNEFSIFMGPKIYSRVGKKTGTVFSIRCLPLGGFCAMEGEETTENTEGAFCNKPWWQRTIILLSGVFMNIILAIVVVTTIFMIYGYETNKVSYVNEFMPVHVMNLEEGDRITDFNGYSVLNPTDYNLVNYAVNLEDSVFEVEKKNGDTFVYKFDRNIDVENKKCNITIYSVDDDDKEKLIGKYYSSWDTDLLQITNEISDNNS